jgi:hypothetical protein
VRTSLLFYLLIFLQYTPHAFGGDECQVTLAESSPMAASGALPVSIDSSHAWYGGAALAALIPKNGVWNGMGPEHNYGDKFWWWRSGYDAKAESAPNLNISARLLDGRNTEIEVSDATSGFSSDPEVNWNSILIGMEFPSSGCWEITGMYDGVESLIIVLHVGAL